MRTLLTAGLAGLFLSSAATAQDEWTFIACEWESRAVGPWSDAEGTLPPYSDSAIYRFNATEFELYSDNDGWVGWAELCVTGPYVLSTSCTITADAVSRVVQISEGAREQISINRLTGAYYATTRYGDDGSGRDARGTCALTNDPTGGRRAF